MNDRLSGILNDNFFKKSDNVIRVDEPIDKVNNFFEFKCKKCGSSDIILIRDDSICYTRYTGMWGSADIVIKCNKCGSACSIIIKDDQ